MFSRRILEHIKYPTGHICCSRKAVGGEVEKLSALGNAHFPLRKTESPLPRGGFLSRDETSRKSLKLLLLGMDLVAECIGTSPQPSFSASLWCPTLLPNPPTPSCPFWKPFSLYQTETIFTYFSYEFCPFLLLDEPSSIFKYLTIPLCSILRSMAFSVDFPWENPSIFGDATVAVYVDGSQILLEF